MMEKRNIDKRRRARYCLPPQLSNTDMNKIFNLACHYADDLIHVTTYKAEKDRQLFQLPIQLEE